ncbi:MAG: sigma-54-dependent Fis family transcriptional regulator [Pirellulales bacterium]|nr:sigma-54-dependent Fis family transcriptional regulator [Pirellulales bacterium]
MPRILVIDDEPAICWGLKRLVASMGHECVVCASAEEGLASAQAEAPDVIVLDVRLPGMSGLEAIDHLRAASHDAPVLLITAYGDLDTAVEAVRTAALEYIVKPFDLEPMRRSLERALAQRDQGGLPGEQCGAAEAAETLLPANGMVGASPAIRTAFRELALAADAPTSVLVVGESGVGKELAARAIHDHSRRCAGPFVAVNVASLNPALAESELFGHVRGAFTGAESDRAGLLAAADGGTLFLDEVADIPLAVQVKLLRALEHGEIIPVGGARPTATDFRIVAATHKDLLTLVQTGQFRHDLYFRLSALQIRLPALRERPEDVGPLADHFLAGFARAVGRSLALGDAARAELQRRPWYGNVRELRNAIEHAAAMARQGTVGVEHLPASLPREALPRDAANKNDGSDLASAVRRWAESRLADPAEQGRVYESFLAEAEPALFAAALDREGQFQSAARTLGVHRTTLRRKADQYGLGDG